jgi:hypothetical protein
MKKEIWLLSPPCADMRYSAYDLVVCTIVQNRPRQMHLPSRRKPASTLSRRRRQSALTPMSTRRFDVENAMSRVRPAHSPITCTAGIDFLSAPMWFNAETDVGPTPGCRERHVDGTTTASPAPPPARRPGSAHADVQVRGLDPAARDDGAAGSFNATETCSRVWGNFARRNVEVMRPKVRTWRMPSAS